MHTRLVSISIGSLSIHNKIKCDAIQFCLRLMFGISVASISLQRRVFSLPFSLFPVHRLFLVSRCHALCHCCRYSKLTNGMYKTQFGWFQMARVPKLVRTLAELTGMACISFHFVHCNKIRYTHVFCAFLSNQ